MDITQQVIAILAEQAMLDPATVQTGLPLADMGIDSLGLVETIFALEEAFDISIPFNANEPAAQSLDLSSVDALVMAVQGLIAKKAA
ncbi:MAG: acyl carrier protein [Cypionkella sp.]|jgi:acyl carrier protein